MEDILPDIIEDNSYKYMLLDDKYICNLYIKGFPKETSFLEIIESIPKEHIYDMSIIIEKQDTMKILKKLSYQISYLGTEINSVNKNQIDLDVMEMSKTDAKDLRKDIQVNNEEVYKISIYFTFFSSDINSLLREIKIFQSKLYSKQIISNITNFRHLDSYKNTLPYIASLKKENESKYITTTALANIFPFFMNTIVDENGIILGTTKDENKMCILDIFSDKYLNSNVCVFGSSGSGKSYFTKLYILKQHLFLKRQIIFDPENEYENLVNSLNGAYLYSSSNKKVFNIMEIEKCDIDYFKENVLENKIGEITSFLLQVINYEEKGIYEKLYEAVKKAYFDKGITDDVNSIYENDTKSTYYIKKVIISKEKFPTLLDVLGNIKGKNLKNAFKENVVDKVKCLTGITNIDKNSNLIAFDLSKYSKEIGAIIIRYFINRENKLLDYKLENRVDTLFYIDEGWKYIKNDVKNNISDLIFSLYKTLRKKRSSIFMITQDISDLFMGENVDFAKSILNNSEFKFFFKLEYTDSEILKKINAIKEEDIVSITKLEKGVTYLMFSNNKVKIKIESNEFEENLIKGGVSSDYNSTCK